MENNRDRATDCQLKKAQKIGRDESDGVSGSLAKIPVVCCHRGSPSATKGGTNALPPDPIRGMHRETLPCCTARGPCAGCVRPRRQLAPVARTRRQLHQPGEEPAHRMVRDEEYR